ncbi:hypothetical protein GCM10022393_32140 [Aquimarina addita]|uniref:PKD domain-containing protein n=1 Tax=Aquimarina addita TaxID=870485 RepID=A0ABP6URB9_9FLAO
MEKSNNIANYHLDKNLILFFAFTILITASIFAYKFINYAPCSIEAFNYNKGILRVDDNIRFKDNTKGVTNRVWDFGDDSKLEKTANPFHRYTKPGEYIVKLKINGSCKWEEKLTIKQKIVPLDSSRIARFSMPDRIEVGEIIQFLDQTKGATSWKWEFGESGRIDSNEKNPGYVYESSGEKTILLVVNDEPRYAFKTVINVVEKENEDILPPGNDNTVIVNNNNTGVIPIKPPEGMGGIVIEDPEPPENEKEDVESITKERFIKLLSLVSDKKATANNFKPYLCNDLNIPMKVNNEETTLEEFVNKVKQKKVKVKKIKTKDLEIKKGDRNCITSIKIQFSN